MDETELKPGDIRTQTEAGWYDPKTRTFYDDWSFAGIPLPTKRLVRLTITKRQTFDRRGFWLTDIEPVSVCREDGTPYTDWPKREAK